MKKILFVTLLLIGAIIGLGFVSCSARYVPDIKEHAPIVLSKNGFTIIGYQGYQWGAFGQYGGCVWYTLQRDKTIYQGCVSKWGKEYHIYNLSALNAVKGN
jgi:hypothetical protein